jgi:hypothetical protein
MIYPIHTQWVYLGKRYACTQHCFKPVLLLLLHFNESVQLVEYMIYFFQNMDEKVFSFCSNVIVFYTQIHTSFSLFIYVYMEFCKLGEEL